MSRKLVNFALFQAGWFTCVLGAATGHEWLGPVVVLLILVLHLTLIERTWAELAFLLVAGLLGTILDSLQEWLGAVRFSGSPVLNILCPLWITALWLVFSTTLSISLSWLQQRYVLAAILGGLAGPLTYIAASRLGALEVPNLGFAVVTVGIEYASIIPLLLLVSRLIKLSRINPAEKDQQSRVLSGLEA